MSAEITLPLWLVVLAGLLAVWALLVRMLLPGMRWMLRRRVNRMIDDLNARLQLRLQPFKLTKRQVLIDRLMFDPEVLAAAEVYATEHNLPREAAMAEVSRYALEIVPSFNAYAYFRIGTNIARRVVQLLYRVRVGAQDEAALAAVDPEATVVFVMNHRSNIDYMLVAYLAATRSALSYAVGEWARIWPLQTLIRSLGAYFIRRNSGDPLYRTVLRRYVQMATAGGVTQAVYPEGGLSRDGRLRAPKLGLISYMVSGFEADGERDIVFVPVGVNYDRVLEDRSLVRSLDETAPKRGTVFAVYTSLRFLSRNLWLMARGRWHRFGYACVGFGAPLSMRAYTAEQGVNFRALDRDRLFAEVEKLGVELMDRVGQVIPALPVSCVATVLMAEPDREFAELDLKAGVHSLMERLETAGAYVHVPRMDRDYAIRVGLRMLTLRHLVDERDGLFRVRTEERALLGYYANAIAHLL